MVVQTEVKWTVIVRLPKKNDVDDIEAGGNPNFSAIDLSAKLDRGVGDIKRDDQYFSVIIEYYRGALRARNDQI